MQKRSFKKATALLLTFFIFISGFLYYRYIALPFVSGVAIELTKAKAIDAINETNKKLLSLKVFYEDYFDYKYNSEGELVFIQSNAPLINQISMIAQDEAQGYMGKLVGENIDVPIGAFTGLSILSSYGWNIPLEILFVSNCLTVYKSEFHSIGINHTLHRFLINITAEISVLIPPNNPTVKVSGQIVVAENIIVGRIPTTYISGDDSNLNYLDLLP